MPKVLIIGSGLGGLSSGVALADKGYDVTVLEQGSQIGGCLQCFERAGVRFETGMHVVGSVGYKEVLYNHLDRIGILDKVQFSQLDKEAYDIVSIGGKRFGFANGHERMIEQMCSVFPDQSDNLRRYWSLVDSIASQAPLYSSPAIPSASFPSYQNRSLNSVLDEVITDPMLRQVLVGNMPLYAAVKDRTPFSTHAFVADFYNRGAYRVVGGSDVIAQTMRERIEQCGGRVLTRQKVTYVDCSGGRVRSVVTADGNTYEADLFISDIHPQQLLDLFDVGNLRKSYSERIKSIPNTQSVFSLFLKFKPDSVPYLNSNFFCYRNATPWTLGNYTDDLWPDGYLFMHNCHRQLPKYAEGAVMLAYMNFADVSRWSDSLSCRRGDDYEAFKHQRAQAMIAALQEEFPGIERNIESYYTATPLTYRDYTLTPNGSMYGILHDINLGVGGRVSYRTKLPNFYLVGQNINAHGILGVLIGSYNVCKYILDSASTPSFSPSFSSSTVIIGGGLGGLLTGALLSKHGQQVTVVEKNRVIGGGLQTFKRQGYEFPTGMHVFGGFQEGGIMKKLCDELGISEQIGVHPTDADCFDEVIGSKVTLRMPRGKERYITYLASLYPHQRDNIRAYVDALYALTEEELAPLNGKEKAPIESQNEQFLWPADAFVAHYITDCELRSLLSYLAPLYSGISGETPAYVHAIVNVLHIEGSYMFDRGSQRMAEALAAVIRSGGGRVVSGEEVLRIETADHKITSVVTATGNRYSADCYISSIDPRRLVEVTDKVAFPPSFRNRINSATYGYSAFKVYIGLKKRALPHVNHPRYYFLNGDAAENKGAWDAADVTLEAWPRCMMAVTSPDSADNYWADTITVMIPTPYRWFVRWAETRSGNRPEEYQMFKGELQRRVVELLEDRIPLLHDAIDKVFASTPLTIRDWLGVSYGSLYGFHTDCNHPLYTKLSVNTKLRNLFLTGQNVNLHGMCGVAITAKLTAESVLHR